MIKIPIVREWSVAPGQDTGSSNPTVLTNGQELLLAYCARNPLFPGWSSGAPLEHPGFVTKAAVIRFQLVRCFKFGYPNSEALNGHPLHRHGLKPYQFQTVENSPWISELCRQNEAHPRHGSHLWEGLMHLIATFEDDTLEVVAKSAELVGVFDSISTQEALTQAGLVTGSQP